MTTEVSAEAIDISPSPRILSVLGDIEFKPWLCLAELVDNAFDDFQEMLRENAAAVDEPLIVNIVLPRDSDGAAGQVTIQDTGRGMTLQSLNDAVRAGWSGNDRFDKLGLFGMGFNIATARLGNVTEVLTTRSGDSEWIGVQIDLRRLATQTDFTVPVVRAPKVDPHEHGTRVTVSELRAEQRSYLARNAKRVREQLGDVYSYLLQQEHYELQVNGVVVKPRRACVWSEDRSVSFGSGAGLEQIPAVIHIDHELPDQAACRTCGNWQSPQLESCTVCQSTRLVVRSRRIHGWVGIQRFIDRTDYGIDFLRNGRKILARDTTIFAWDDPNSAMGRLIPEYPMEVPAGFGRIIGEIHLDHVPVNYQKTAFIQETSAWVAARRLLRGDDGPLLPKSRRSAGYPEQNNGPIARLVRGYRRNVPGYRYLTPGDGRNATHEKAREMAKRFAEGDAEYQTDQKWWEAIEYHERVKAGRDDDTPSPEDQDGGVLEGLDLPTPAAGDGAEPPPPPAETEQARLERYRSNGTAIPDLAGEVNLPNHAAVTLTSYTVTTELRDNDGRVTPVLVAMRPRQQVWAFADVSHRIFQQFDTDVRDLVLLELANVMRQRAQSHDPLPAVFERLKTSLLADRRLDRERITADAIDILSEVAAAMAEAIQDEPDRAWQELSETERHLTETALATEGLTLNAAREDGGFVRYAPPTFLPRLLAAWPDPFMDGGVFRTPYNALDPLNVQARWLNTGRVAGYLYDTAIIAERTARLSSDGLKRSSLSLQLLRDELVAGLEE